MAREILKGFGPERNIKGDRAECGGVERARDVMGYQKPQGPTSIGNRKVGLGGTVHGCGTQGSHGIAESESGSPGLGGDKRSGGSQR